MPNISIYITTHRAILVCNRDFNRLKKYEMYLEIKEPKNRIHTCSICVRDQSMPSQTRLWCLLLLLCYLLLHILSPNGLDLKSVIIIIIVLLLCTILCSVYIEIDLESFVPSSDAYNVTHMHIL